jgi:hypothetical protein
MTTQVIDRNLAKEKIKACEKSEDSRMKGMFLGIFLLMTLNGFGGEPVPLSFQMIQTVANLAEGNQKAIDVSQKLSTFNGQNVLIRGFLYCSETGTWVLSPEPNLKSCCAGSVDKVFRQIFVEGVSENPSNNRAVTLCGTFAINPLHNDSGELIQLYSLQNAVVVKKEAFSFLKIGAMTLGVLAIGFGTVPYLRRMRKNGSR